MPWPFDPMRSRERRRIAVRVAGADGDDSAWSESARHRGRPARSRRLGGAAVTATFDGVARTPATDPVPSHVRRRRRPDEGPALCLRVRRVHRRLQRHRRSATTSSLPAGPLRTIASATRRTTSHRPAACRRQRHRDDRRRRLVPRPPRLPRRPHAPSTAATSARSPSSNCTTRTAPSSRWRPDERLAGRARRAAVGEPLRRRGVDARLADAGLGVARLRRQRLAAVRRCWPRQRRRWSPRAGPPVRRIETLRAVVHTDRAPSGDDRSSTSDRTSRAASGSRVRGQAGDEITLRHAEVLEDGELATWLLRTAAATDRYVLAGARRESYEPEFTIHGFRYAGVDGWPGELDADDDRGRRLPLGHGADGIVPTAPTTGSTGSTTTCGGACGATSSTCRPTAPNATSGSAGRATSRCSRRPRRSSTTAAACSRRGWPTSPPSSATIRHRAGVRALGAS